MWSNHISANQFEENVDDARSRQSAQDSSWSKIRTQNNNKLEEIHNRINYYNK